MRRATSRSKSGKTVLRTVVLVALVLPGRWAAAEDATWIKLKGEVYGAQADATGPIGGGQGYTRIVTKGDFVARDLDGLLKALGQAKAGQVVFIPGDAEIDCTARIYIERLVLVVPGGVTLASDRGSKRSPGALLCSDTLDTPTLVRAAGPGARITGLRIRGPNPKRYLDHHRRSFAEGRGHSYYYKFPTSNGIETIHPGLQVDNCEISAFSCAGISLSKGNRHHVHHNFIHHCQYQGLGYGISHSASSSLIEYNLFDFNRHSIAGTGEPGCGYEARHNVELGTSLSHCFDMHGGRDRHDGTDVAGTTILIHHNMFRAPERAVCIRGVPEDACKVFRNWFPKHASAEAAVKASAKTVVDDNAFGDGSGGPR